MSTEPTSEQRQQAAAELARTDLMDIRALRKSEPFRRYWLRQLRQKRDKAEVSLKEDNGLTHEKREITRQLYLAYTELEQMMDRQEPALITQFEQAQAG